MHNWTPQSRLRSQRFGSFCSAPCCSSPLHPSFAPYPSVLHGFTAFPASPPVFSGRQSADNLARSVKPGSIPPERSSDGPGHEWREYLADDPPSTAPDPSAICVLSSTPLPPAGAAPPPFQTGTPPPHPTLHRRCRGHFLRKGRDDKWPFPDP